LVPAPRHLPRGPARARPGGTCAPAAVASLRPSLPGAHRQHSECGPISPGSRCMSRHRSVPRLPGAGGGVSDRATGAKLRPDQPHRMASNTRPTFRPRCSALRGRKDQAGRPDRGAPVEGIRRNAAARRISARCHTAPPAHPHQRHLRLRDVAPFRRQCWQSNKRWTREKQVTFAVEKGQPYGAPGTVFHYWTPATSCWRDRRTDHRTAAGHRAQDPAGIQAERLEEHLARDPSRFRQYTAERAHQYIGDVDTWA
jgi:hypothetical protein